MSTLGLPRRGSIRFRVTALATFLAALILAVTAVALVALQRQQLVSNLDSSLAQRADTYQATLDEVDGGALALSRTFDEDRALQIVAATGTVLASTPNIAGHPPIALIREPASAQVISQAALPLLEDDNYRILSRPVTVDGNAATLHVAQNVDDLNDTVRGLVLALSFSVPTVVILLAGLTWWLVGRTLEPVEQIRAEVASIGGAAMDRRVPVPGTADEVASLAMTMNQMLDRLEAASVRQRRFVADASHELRTPLTRLRTEVEVDLNHPDRADFAATHQRILAETVDLQHLLDDLLFLARSDEGQTTVRARPTDLDDIVRREVGYVRETESRVTVDTSAVGTAHLHADPAQLSRVVRNLLSNAVRHAEGTVTVSVTEDDDTVRLAMADDGPGVPSEAQERIFERFARSDDARNRASGGTGLGLSIVRDIISRHHGSVAYTDAPGGGACLVVMLPKAASAGPLSRYPQR